MNLTYKKLEAQLAKTKTKQSITEAKLAAVRDLLKQALIKIQVLEKQLNKNSKNSSKPPSSDRNRVPNSVFGPQLIAWSASLKGELRLICKELAKFYEKILEKEEYLWVFSKYTNVERTNNQTQRNLQKRVLWKKRSYGALIEKGKNFVEVLERITCTARDSKKNPINFITEAIQAYSGFLIPSNKFSVWALSPTPHEYLHRI